jgi:hypothetical protein
VILLKHRLGGSFHQSPDERQCKGTSNQSKNITIYILYIITRKVHVLWFWFTTCGWLYERRILYFDDMCRLLYSLTLWMWQMYEFPSPRLKLHHCLYGILWLLHAYKQYDYNRILHINAANDIGIVIKKQWLDFFDSTDIKENNVYEYYANCLAQRSNYWF